MTVADLTETELIARIQDRLPPQPDWILVGIGDDAAVVEPERNRLEVLSVDSLIDGVHFDRRFTPADAIGHRALAANLSDLAAMGAAPRLALLSLALPPDLPCADFDALIAAIASLGSRYRLHVAGGNLSRSPGPLVVDITVLGTVKRRQALTRAGARPGDELYVSGVVGAAAAGLQMLQSDAGAQGSGVSGGPGRHPCVTRYLYPEPRVRLGLLLSRNRAATACMDLSDGLADGVWRIAEASGVGAAIEAEALPVDAETRGWFEARGLDPAVESLRGGDDYELIFAVRPRQRSRLAAARRLGGATLTRIGVCTEDRAVVLRRMADGARRDTPLPRGFTHFR
jgi:thiamine-monophosphate kinase